MECACVYSDASEGDSAQYFRSERGIAKREHKCGECGETIKPGDEYEVVSADWGGDWSTHKTCAVCLDIRKELFCDGWYYGMILDELEEHIREMDCAIGSEAILNLGIPARDVVFNMIEKCWEHQMEE